MSDSSSNSRNNADGDHASVSDKQLAKLRSLIIGPADHRIDTIAQQLEDPEQRAHAISHALPRAVTIRASKDNQLATALEPIMENAIRASIKKDRKILVDALFPVMGPAIRKAMASTIQGLIENFNQILEHSISIRGLRWRLEALRTNRSFAEVVLLNTLIYQVEQVFLIHRESGLLVEHVVAKTAVAQNPDVVSGMLTAIKDFVQDSFGATQEDTLETFQVGQHKVWIEHGSYAMLSIVINGNPPADLREMMRDVLDEIHLKQSDELSSFDGNSDAFEACRPILHELLQVQFKKRKKRPAYRSWLTAAVFMGLIGWVVFLQMSDARRWGRFVDRLRNQPGMVVTQIKEQDGRHHIYGLKDPYAPNPSAIMASDGIPPESVVFHWEPYQSAHPEFARRRAAVLFNPPSTIRLTLAQGTMRVSGAALQHWIEDARRLARIVPWINHYVDGQVVDIDAHLDRPPTVTLALDGKTLYARGSAPRTWIEQARTAAYNLPEIETYDDTHLIDADVKEWDSLSEKIVESVFHFGNGLSKLTKGQEKSLQAFIEAVKRLITLSHLLDRPLRIVVVGHTDQSGDDELNMAISLNRAQVFADLLIASGIKPEFVAIHAVGSQEPFKPDISEANRAANRRVSFKVINTDS